MTRFTKVMLHRNIPKIPIRRNIFTHLGKNNAQINCPKGKNYQKSVSKNELTFEIINNYINNQQETWKWNPTR